MLDSSSDPQVVGGCLVFAPDVSLFLDSLE